MQGAAASIKKQVEAESAMLDTRASLATELQAAEAAVKVCTTHLLHPPRTACCCALQRPGGILPSLQYSCVPLSGRPQHRNHPRQRLVPLTVQEAEGSLEEARGAIRDLSGQRAKLFTGAQAAEERGSAARARLPDLEAGKRAAASSRVSCCKFCFPDWMKLYWVLTM